MRRQADLFDAQSKALLEVSELAYRLRNAIREAALPLPELSRKAIARVTEAQRAFNESLYTSRAVLPEALFVLAHDLKNPAMSAIHRLESLRDPRHSGRELAPEQAAELGAHLQYIEQLFRRFIEQTRHHVGVDHLK